MSKGGSAPPPPTKSSHTEAISRIANDRWEQYKSSLLPVEMANVQAIKDIASDTNYAGAMASGANMANAISGDKYMNAAMQLAAGGSAFPITQTGSQSLNALADAAYGGAANQRGSYLNQAQGLVKLGDGTVDQSIGALKYVSDADTSRINSNFATDVGSRISQQNANTALLGELTQLGTMYGAHNGWFSGKDYMGIDSSGKFNGVRGRSSGWEIR